MYNIGVPKVKCESTMYFNGKPLKKPLMAGILRNLELVVSRRHPQLIGTMDYPRIEVAGDDRLCFHSAVMLKALKHLEIDLKTTSPKSYLFKNESWMPLYVEVRPIGRGDLEICIAHFGEQNGDMMSDPAMTFVYTLECGGSAQLIPYSYRNDYVGVFDTAKTYRAIVGRRVFANTWGRNIMKQGFKAEQNVNANIKVTA